VTEQELRRTAVIIPPTGRAVLCVWAAVPAADGDAFPIELQRYGAAALRDA